jgi:hypothetical protein
MAAPMRNMRWEDLRVPTPPAYRWQVIVGPGRALRRVLFASDGSPAEVLRELPLKLALERDYGDRHVPLPTLDFGFYSFREPSTTFFGPSDRRPGA